MNVKDIKLAMAAGAKPLESKITEIQNANIAALQKLSSEQSNELGELIDVAEEHDYLIKYQWREKYNLESKSDRAIFIGFFINILKRIETEPNEYQKIYYDNFTKFIGIKNPVEVDIEFLSENDDIQFQNLLFQVLCEYFYIGDKSFQFLNNTLFDNFSVSKRNQEILKEIVEWDYTNHTAEGFVEKWLTGGIYKDTEVVNDNVSEMSSVGSNLSDNLQRLVLSEIVMIEPENCKKYSDCDIYLESFITVNGELIFQNCRINYGINEKGFISLSGKSKVSFNNCKFKFSGCDSKQELLRKEYQNEISVDLLAAWSLEKNARYLLISQNENVDDKPEITFTNCTFENCIQLAKLESKLINFNECLITYKEDYYFPAFWFQIYEPEIIKFISCPNSDILLSNCVLDNSETFYNFLKKLDTSIVGNFTSLTDCVVSNSILNLSNADISKSRFTNCTKIASDVNNFDSCDFINCDNIFNINDGVTSIKNCHFLDCTNSILQINGGTANFEYCSFNNLKQTHEKYSFFTINNAKTSRLFMNNCTFEKISVNKYGTLIQSPLQKEKIDKVSCLLEKCFFGITERISSNPLIELYGHYSNGWSKQDYFKLVEMNNCNGESNLLASDESKMINRAKLDLLRGIVNRYLPKLGVVSFYSDLFTGNPIRIERKIENVLKMNAAISKEEILGFCDLSISGNSKNYLVFANDRVLYAEINDTWTYFYNESINSAEREVKYVLLSSILKKDVFWECISEIENLLTTSVE